ncbi:hypothetical protein AB1285_25625, partial [Microbacterium sp. NRRL B-14842]|uniref:hypothetical protein n=1 Tax=Microbacterium sp. NRRL B-14842 TaxID=3162881 RepID=UPI003D2C63DC
MTARSQIPDSRVRSAIPRVEVVGLDAEPGTGRACPFLRGGASSAAAAARVAAAIEERSTSAARALASSAFAAATAASSAS